MILAVQIFQIIFYCIGILFMVTLTILSIWGFILFNKFYKTKRIHNFLLDKIHQSITQLINTNYKSNHDVSIDDTFDVDDVINEEELFTDKSESNNETFSF